MRLLLTTCCLLLSACATQLEDYAQPQHSIMAPFAEKFVLAEYFSGRTYAWGMLKDHKGFVSRRFCVVIDGDFKRDMSSQTAVSGTLFEKFYWDDGEEQTRTWEIKRLPNGEYQGSAGDVEGLAWGDSEGFALRWQYTLQVPVKGSVYNFKVDDWMYQMDKQRLFNQSTLSKFGLDLAEIHLFFDKSPTSDVCQPVAEA